VSSPILAYAVKVLEVIPPGLLVDDLHHDGACALASQFLVYCDRHHVEDFSLGGPAGLDGMVDLIP
jgi:hypothetical protein